MTNEDVKQGGNRRTAIKECYVCADRICTKENSVKRRQYYKRTHYLQGPIYPQNECRKSTDVKINMLDKFLFRE